MKKKLLAAVLAVLMILALAGCSGNKPAAEEPVPAPGGTISGVPGADGSGQDAAPDEDPDDGLAAGAGAVLGGIAGVAGAAPFDPEDSEEPEPPADPDVFDPEEDYIAVITIEGYGTVKAELYADKAPVTVENFVTLARAGFYDGLTFHRIMKGFMMQGGDPLGNGTGGAQETIYGEFASNGWTANDISHVRGVLSMARAKAPDTASSQFFIVHADAGYLDGEYAAFGKVFEGMDVVDAVCEAARPIDENGTMLSAEQPVISSIRIEVLGGPAYDGLAADDEPMAEADG